MSEQDSQNPFAALMTCSPSPSIEDDDEQAMKTDEVEPNKNGDCASKDMPNVDVEMESSDSDISNVVQDGKDAHLLSHFYEFVFRVTLSKEPCCQKTDPSSLIFINEVHVALHCQVMLDEASTERAVFERLLLGDPLQCVVRRKNIFVDDGDAGEKRIMFYLYQCYRRLKCCSTYKVRPVETSHHIIMSQAVSALSNPEMYPDSKAAEDFINVFLHYHDLTDNLPDLTQFLIDVSNAVVEEGLDLASVFSGSLIYLQEKLMKSSVTDGNLFLYIELLNHFTVTENLMKMVLKHSMPKEVKNGKAYQNSLLGLPLSVSCLPKSEVEQFEFFQEPSRSSSQDHNITGERLALPLGNIAKNMHRLFEKILRKSADTREMLLQWLGNCLDANAGRAKIWNSHLPEVFASLHASDGFFINLTTVLLHLCKPFADPCSPKLFNIDPVFCFSPASSESHRNGVHIRGLATETCLIPREGNHAIDEHIKFNFTTEIFFATHYACRIGVHVIHEKLVKINQDLVRVQRLYEEARSQGGESSDVAQRIKDNMEKGMSKFLTYRTALLVQETLDLMMQFHTATATWLVNLSTSDSSNVFKTLTFPTLEDSSDILSYVPEFIVENIIDCVVFVKRFSSNTFEMAGPTLDHIMTLILMFMGSPHRVKNPHLRAHLAEMLESLMPTDDDVSMMSPSASRERIFTSHLFASEAVPTLLHVFVSIEMTGQSVAFEQKFQYRRPMYVVLDYLWNYDVHKMKMKELAKVAERNIESSHPPLFLHFINLLINDAIFLLDEALSCMSKLREIQLARDAGAWESLSEEQQQQNEGNFQHLGLLAKFHNVMSNETIHTLQWLTIEIKSIFCHPSIVERITAMLNYFLFNLVGPQKKNFKVKDLKEYEFKPQELVRDICRIYQNLGSRDGRFAELFCQAVSRDGRSYSRELFPLAQVVLNKIGDGALATQLSDIALKVHELAVKQQLDDELLTGAPDEFMDPIMNTVMKDPVKLPSSGVTVDRPTIARHLLSDQTDPFNRSPLTMDMVQPDEELKSKIDKWLYEKRHPQT